VANWAIVVGVDRYWSEGANLRGAVRDALAVRDWLLDPNGGNVPATNLQLALSPTPSSPAVDPGFGALDATKANLVIAINNLMVLSGGAGERLYFYFAGHGLTTRVSNRDESAVLATDFTNINTDQSLALRSVWEFFETTQFQDQFLFVDACRNVPPWGDGAEFELGRWTLPRSRDPGTPPVQQFILYATSPKLMAGEIRATPGQEHGAFTAALLEGLEGAGAAKAWSWQRQCYEVRWERLADYVKRRVEAEALKVGGTPEAPLIQIPQDTGSRGVAGRDRDALLTSFPDRSFPKEKLEIVLEPDSAYPVAEVRVLNPLGDIVAQQTGFTGGSAAFELAPGTYALRAAAPKIGEGHATEPIELYAPLGTPPRIQLQPLEAPPPPPPAAAPAPAVEAAATRSVDLESVGTGTIPIVAPDPLSMVEVKDETGNTVQVGRPGDGIRLRPGFYQLRHVGADAPPREQEAAEDELGTQPVRVALMADGTNDPLRLQGVPLSDAALELLQHMGGKPGPGNTAQLDGCEPAAWASTATLVAMALGRALNGTTGKAALGLPHPDPPASDRAGGGVAVYVVSETGPIEAGDLEVRIWPSGTEVPEKRARLHRLTPELVGYVEPVETPGAYWAAVHRKDQGKTMVFALTVVNRRMATVVVQITAGIRLFQHQPALAGGDAASPDRLRHAEYLERLLLAGRLDGARELALELAQVDDPFIGCLSGYVLLRLGLFKELGELTERTIAAAPTLADAYVLRGEHAAATGSTAGKQAFAEAIGAGVPMFGEGLTRLLEGLRTHGIDHPRAAIVRYVFQNHMRGSMWASFTPGRELTPGRLVITAADTGLEA
jgi:hypothetical protein